MKQDTITLFLVAAILTLAFPNSGDATAEITLDRHFPSPDGRFVAALTDDPRGNLHIRATATGALYKAYVFRPLLSVQWTGDSQSLVTVEHLAGGSETAVIHFDGANWNRHEIDPAGSPPPNHHYAVISQEIGRNSLRLSYKLTDEKANGVPIAFYICSFDVDARSGKIRNIRKRKITRDAYESLSYRPANKRSNLFRH